jgi:hypothetical protein
MRARPGTHTFSRAAVAALMSLLVAGLLSIGSAKAHTFTKSDDNDTPGKLDIRASTVSHTATSIVFKIRTYESWTPASLRSDSVLVVQIDKNNDRRYDRCAVILFASRLRSVLTNCGSTIIRNLPVGKPNATTVRTTIPKAQTGLVHWWATATWWVGASPCRSGCVDFSPNRFPDILHDLVPPNINMATTPLRSWVNSTTEDFQFPFTVNDAHSGIKTWRVERRTYESTTWATVVSGTGGGAKSPTITGIPGHSLYRVVAIDKQGNKKIGPARHVFVPRDDDSLGPQGVYTDATPVVVPDATAFRGSYTTLGVGESVTYNYDHTAGPCRPFELIGPGGGDWTVAVTVNDVPFTVKDGTTTPAGPRQVLFSFTMCDSTEFVFDVTEAVVEFPVDGVVAKAS